MKLQIPPVYPITDKRLAGSDSHLAILRELVRGGAAWVQIRDKVTPAGELLQDLRRCVEFARRRGVVLIVNDRCDLALSCGADGVHLGQDDLPPAAARSLLGTGAILGFSTHNLRQAAGAARCPIDYLGFGPIFDTATKESRWPATGLQRLRRVCLRSALPVVAIGGIGQRRRHLGPDGRRADRLEDGGAAGRSQGEITEREFRG